VKDWYKLNDDMSFSNFETEEEYLEAMRDFDKGKHKIALTNLPHGFYVSTVFLRLDHSFGDEKPVLFESMVFNKEKLGNMIELDCDRYHNYEQAISGHNEMVQTWLKKIDTESIEELLGDKPRGKIDIKKTFEKVKNLLTDVQASQPVSSVVRSHADSTQDLSSSS
jgi:hypothetical protein